MRYGLFFFACWLVAWVVLPWDASATHAGTAVGHAAASFGGALVLWAPIAGTISAISWFRRKTH